MFGATFPEPDDMRLDWYPGWRDNAALDGLKEGVMSWSVFLNSTTIAPMRHKGAAANDKLEGKRANDRIEGKTMRDQAKERLARQPAGVGGRNARKVLLGMLPKNGVGAEIGVHLGGFSEQILGHAAPRKLILIDPWLYFPDPEYQQSWYGESGAQGQAEMDQRYEKVCTRFEEQIAAGRIEVQRGLSQDVLAGLPDDHLDWIYIDGDHSYEAVKRDLELSFAKVRNGGFIAGDDYQLGKWWKDGVVRAVNEFIGTRSVIVKFMRNDQFLLRKIGK
ncbi:MAG: class I SAM-dependent methyltransferase [Pseudomonadales bacterium]|nr:class I SAM-dependent methyltransferase [Pseudomonadales bacterium]